MRPGVFFVAQLEVVPFIAGSGSVFHRPFGAAGSGLGLGFRRGFRRDDEAAPPHFARNIDGADGTAEAGVFIGAEDHGGFGVFFECLDQGGAEAVVGDALLAEKEGAFAVNGDFEGIDLLGFGGAGLGQGDVDTELLAEGGGDHEEDEEEEHDVDEGRDVDGGAPACPAGIESAAHEAFLSYKGSRLNL